MYSGVAPSSVARSTFAPLFSNSMPRPASPLLAGDEQRRSALICPIDLRAVVQQQPRHTHVALKQAAYSGVQLFLAGRPRAFI